MQAAYPQHTPVFQLCRMAPILENCGTQIIFHPLPNFLYAPYLKDLLVLFRSPYLPNILVLQPTSRTFLYCCWRWIEDAVLQPTSRTFLYCCWRWIEEAACMMW